MATSALSDRPNGDFGANGEPKMSGEVGPAPLSYSPGAPGGKLTESSLTGEYYIFHISIGFYIYINEQIW